MSISNHYRCILIVFVFFSCSSGDRDIGRPSPDEQGYGLTPQPFDKVILEDKFWKPRLETQVETLVPFALDKTLPAQTALKQAGNFIAGIDDDLPKPHRFQSSDLYKVMEGAAYLLLYEENEELENRMDKIIDIIANAQREDGYLYVAHITGVAKDHDHWGGGGMGDTPYSFVFHSHELYNMGHMYEGAIAYYRATGKDKWLKVAEKNARHINKVFFEGDPDYNDGEPVNQAPGHQELELALAKLYRLTGNKLYLEMAKKFLDIRGVTFVPEGEGVLSAIYAQQHQPVAQQKKAVGHAVRAMYLYSGMADVGALSGTDEYNAALESIWHDLVDTKISITGGLGAVHGIEGFGPAYVLPNKEAYNETCAAVGNVFFNFRMFLMTGDAKYMDVAEVSLLNNALAGVNIEGNKFFYVNPLEADGTTPFNHGRNGRSPWFNTACCPSNIARLIPQISGMMYSYTKNEIYVSFYGSNSTGIPLADGEVAIKQESNYPFNGEVKLKITPEKNQYFKLKMRIPTWARTDRFVPGKLYKFVSEIKEEWSVRVNGQPVEAILEDGFAAISRNWEKGDVVALEIPMPVRYNRTIEEVEANRGRVAITRGPLVYAAEGIDNNGMAQRFFLDETPENERIGEDIIREGILRDVVVISLPAREVKSNDVTEGNLQLIPYYAWNNREDGSMIIWLPDSEAGVQFSANNTARGGKYKKVSASSTHKMGSLNAIADPRRPASSIDRTIHSWIAENDQPQWISIELKEIQKIRSIGLYWFDDNRRVKVPKSWKIQYLKGDEWVDMDIYVTDHYSTDKDEYNVVHPGSELKVRKIRINIDPQPKSLVGLLDVDLEFENL
ncbi:MAG: glycoside hydrolase family 127 protein [Cytophagales bacterium]|nr:glycoside hydrolase family 127 protein [Cytophagales bacterium]